MTHHLKAPLLTPPPQQVEYSGYTIPLYATAGILAGAGTSPEALLELRSLLIGAGVKRVVPCKDWHSAAKMPLAVYVGKLPADPAVQQEFRSRRSGDPLGIPEEGYTLAVRRSKHGGSMIVLAGADHTGTLYAVRTLKQLIRKGPMMANVPAVTIRDFPAFPVRGVVEGFYGGPWSPDDRVNLIAFLGDHKMNTYLYAPKDDPYLRGRWREPYPEGELRHIRRYVDAAEKAGVRFVYALSPGLDICFSSNEEFQKLAAKASQMWTLGVRHFSLLMDDIFQNPNCADDVQKFGGDESPAAAAQAYLLNRFNREFVQAHPGASRLITAPTEYYQDGSSPYRKRFAELVDPGILVCWTGIGIAPAVITSGEAERIHKVFNHDMLLWDNYPVTDYVREKLFLGPLEGRDPELHKHGQFGYLSNPMEHLQASLIALFTAADYAWKPEAYRPWESWERSLKEFGGPLHKELRILTENHLSSAVHTGESPNLTALLAAFWEDYEKGAPEKAAARLTAYFGSMRRAASRLAQMHNPDFVRETADWLKKIGFYGKAGEAAVSLLLAMMRDSGEEADARYSAYAAVLAQDTVDIEVAEPRTGSRRIDGENRERGESELIRYTPVYGSRTGTNEWGYEVTVVNGRIIREGDNNSVIPADGYVLSLHSGQDREWLKSMTIVGAKVDIRDGRVTISVEKGTYPVPNKKVSADGVMEPFLQRVSSAYEMYVRWRENRGFNDPISTLPAWESNVLANMTDGRAETYFWSGRAPQSGDYVGVNLGQTAQVRRVRISLGHPDPAAPQAGDLIRSASLEASLNGLSWTKLAEFTEQREIDFTPIAPFRAHFVRLKSSAVQIEWVMVREFDVTAERDQAAN
ncbi:beta-N-acetylglucosaminidase domain-containing protein [Paenibacillus chitinolyticus]|uniref:beta-N-acetylglucosaminidase domain-containing protein n=1 Tax=Paenibacillus chitinolyticus TaxID=79263 RepID=UPI00366DCB45